MRFPTLDPLGGSFYSSGSNPVEADSRLAPVAPSPSGVEELDAVYGPLVAAPINGARLAAGGNSLPDVDLFTAPVGVMDDRAVKLYRRAVDSDLKCSGVETPNADASTPLELLSALLHVTSSSADDLEGGVRSILLWGNIHAGTCSIGTFPEGDTRAVASIGRGNNTAPFFRNGDDTLAQRLEA
jgi:hypothetical protein